MERSISRSDLVAQDASTSESESGNSVTAAEEKLQTFGNVQFDLITQHDHRNDDLEIEKGEEEELDFRLFATSANTTSAPAKKLQDGTHKIRIRSPSPDDSEPGFVDPFRPLSFYIATSPSSEQHAKYVASAVSGTEILLRSHSLWPGSAYPWKVTHVSMMRKDRARLARITSSQELSTNFPNSRDAKQRSRPGKQMRLRRRIKATAERVKAEEAKQEAVEKEVEEKEKRNRRNREKKIKRRAREKAKKVESKEGIEVGNVLDSDEST